MDYILKIPKKTHCNLSVPLNLTNIPMKVQRMHERTTTKAGKANLLTIYKDLLEMLPKKRYLNTGQNHQPDAE
jgi:hypothetical protein